MLREKIVKNTGVILLGDMVNKLSSIVLLYFFSRYLGASGYGKFSFVLFYVGLFGSLTDLGIKSIMVRELSRSREDKETFFGMSLLLASCGSLLAVILCSAVALCAGYTPDVRALIAIASLTLVVSFRDLTFRQMFEALFQVRLNMAYPTLINALNEILVVAACLAVIALGGSIGALTAAYTAAYIPGFIVIMLFARGVVRPRFSFDRALLLRIARMALPLGIAVALSSVYDKIGGVMLRMMQGDEAVGYFSVAYRIAISLKVIPVALMISVFPLLSGKYLEDGKEFLKILRTTVTVVMLIGLPLAAGFTVFSREIITLVSGRGFLPAADALVFVMWAAAVLFVNLVFLYAFIAMNRQKTAMLVSLLTLMANVIGNAYLIPRFSYLGATAALVLSESAGLLCGLLFIRRYVSDFPLSLFFRAALAGGAMAATLFLPAAPWIRFSLAMAVFALVSFAVRLVTRDELLLLRSLIWKR